MTSSVLVNEEIGRFLSHLWLPGEVRELRIPRHDEYRHTASGYFDSPAGMAEAAASWDGKANIYITLNPVDPALLARAHNRIVTSAEYATADADVICRRWFYVDIDPVRRSGISSTDAEREAALATLGLVTQSLSEAGWPDPLTAMSGNGYYALYRVDLPNSPKSAGLIKCVLQSLASRFDTPTAHVDTAVFNASRIGALIGTLKRKGDQTAERPHRRSELIMVPDHLQVVDEALLNVVAESRQKGTEPAPSPGHVRQTQRGSLLEALEDSGILYREQPPDAQGVTWYHVQQCPFHDDGRPFECGVGQKLPDGPYAGKCFHPEGVDKGWQEWKQALSLRVGRNGHGPSPSNNGDKTAPQDTERLSDTWNAHRLVAENGDDLLWCETFKQWFVYDGTRYARDVTREVERRAEKTVTQLYEYAAALQDGDERRRMAGWAMSSESRHRLTNMVESAKRMAPVHPSEFDRDPFLLNILNGTVDLRTQQLRPHRRADRLTKRADVRFNAEGACPQWLAFLDRIFAENQALIGFTQRLFGYCLTGLLTEPIIVILYGTGANGKSTLLQVLRSLAGDYAYHCRPEVFTAKRNDSQGFELVPLAGSRVVTASETGAGRRLDEALVKEMTGGEPINCAPKYGDFFTFQPAFKPLLATNHKPEIRGADEGIWRRVFLLPIVVTIPEAERDRTLPGKLQAELSGILNWALVGVRDFLATGLGTPSEVRSATAEYRAEQDVLGNWIEDRCTMGEQVSDEYAALYQDYVSWCAENKEEPINKTRFSASLDERGCPAHRGTKGKRLRLGIARRGLLGDG